MRAADIERYVRDYVRVSSWNRVKFDRLTAVLSHMHDRGIDCILLKGADLIPRLYGVLGLRPLGDVDMLVHECALPSLDLVLRQLGYRPEIDGNPAYRDPDGILALDIVTSLWYAHDQRSIWRRAVSRDVAGVPIKGLGTNDLLIYVTAYNVVHRGWVTTSFARDVAVLVQKEAVDWDFVVDEACRSHLRIPIYHGLAFVVRRWAGVGIPDHVLRRLAPSTVSQRLCSLALEQLVTDEPVGGVGHLLLFLTQPGWKKWRWVRDAFFPSAAFLGYRYGDRSEAHAFRIRLARPLHLLSETVRLVLRLTRRRITARV